jgi:hypothetical protein
VDGSPYVLRLSHHPDSELLTTTALHVDRLRGRLVEGPRHALIRLLQMSSLRARGGRRIAQSFVLLLACLPLADCTSSGSNKCAPSPSIQATWPGHSVLLYSCGGFLPQPMPSAPAALPSGINPQQIELRVGQQLTLTKSSGWSSYHVNGVATDDPTVLAISKQTTGDVIGVFTALAPGHADVGLRTDYCPTTPVCEFTTATVVP